MYFYRIDHKTPSHPLAERGLLTPSDEMVKDKINLIAEAMFFLLLKWVYIE
jgi:hypothetical protein